MKGSPFTRLCEAASRPPSWNRVDLHLHTDLSDGELTPERLVDECRRARLKAMAVTDHDSVEGIARAKERARSAGTTGAVVEGMDVVSGVEITARVGERVIHLLGYFVDERHEELRTVLDRQRAIRRDRINTLAERLVESGSADPRIRDEIAGIPASVALGRPHLVRLLRDGCRTPRCADARSAVFSLNGLDRYPWIEADSAVHLVHAAGGAAVWAHPPDDDTHGDFEAVLRPLTACGLDGLEAEYPWPGTERTRRIRQIAASAGLIVTGGSDSHGIDPPHRRPGTRTISTEELDRIRQVADRRRRQP